MIALKLMLAINIVLSVVDTLWILVDRDRALAWNLQAFDFMVAVLKGEASL